ncbi:hypothetical protein [Algibacter pectinivorans]|uniref:Uncharacterized protein n=1 Tax=Algibacter pectinivorans TaxID=870482 RepID=A0A1I1R2C9_9FLAO|nr:hypothetical protein [Algibacter pectinivorans]SFD28544.1 hypothetical protein SAMN04487987_10898 [Algibacter pectinivorans]
MTIFKHIKPKNERIKVNVGIKTLKQIIDSKEKKIHFKWLSEDSFIISLNFSFGSSRLFDTHYANTKSDIIATGTLKAINDFETEINLTTKSKYWLMYLLLPPIGMLLIEFIFNLGIPVAFFFLFPILYILIVYVVQQEDKKLLKRFKELLKQ